VSDRTKRTTLATQTEPPDARASQRLELKWVSAGSLAGNPQNWRTHPPGQISALKQMLSDPSVGWAGCLLYNARTQRLVDGHARRDCVAPDTIVPVLVGDWTPEAEKKILVSLDPIGAMAIGDVGKLEELLAEVSLDGEFFDGLRDQLDQMLFDSLKALAEQDAATDIVEDEAPDPPTNPITKPGDLWQLGPHRLLCGDSTNPEHIDRLMAGERAALVATDPPYLVDYTGERPNDSGKDWTDTYHEVDITDADAFFRNLFANVLKFIAPHAAIYCWHAHKRQALISRVWQDLGILDHQQIVWVKPSGVFGRSFWHFQHEPCMMGWVKGSAPAHNGEHSITSVWAINWEGKNRIVGNEHPTQKPVEIFARPMRKHTRPGDVCFEPFSGSGSQIMAAEQLGRRCFACEIEPAFVDVAVQRWEKFTGRKAERLSGVQAH
jgi:DNA modification methylase